MADRGPRGRGRLAVDAAIYRHLGLGRSLARSSRTCRRLDCRFGFHRDKANVAGRGTCRCSKPWPCRSTSFKVLELYDIADGKTAPGDGDPQIVLCMDEFGPLSLLPGPGKQWAPSATKTAKGSDRAPRRRRRRVTYTRAQGVRDLMAALPLMTDHMFGHVKTSENRTGFWRSADTRSRSTRRTCGSPS